MNLYTHYHRSRAIFNCHSTACFHPIRLSFKFRFSLLFLSMRLPMPLILLFYTVFVKLFISYIIRYSKSFFVANAIANEFFLQYSFNRYPHSENAVLCMSVNEFGSSTLFNFLQPQNAFLQILLTPLLIVTRFKFLHPQKLAPDI